MPNALDFFLQMEKEGKTDSEIVLALQEKGFTPQEVNDAVNQSKIKKAVVAPEGMQPSIMQGEEEEQQPQIPVPVPSKKRRAQQFAPTVQQPVMQMPQEYQYPTQQQAYDYSYNYQQPAPVTQNVDVETIEEISEEVVNEKMSELRNKVDDISEFRQSVQSRLTDVDERLKRIELSMDRLQAALIGKVQDYNQNIKDLGAEMQAVEGAFSKILNPLVDNIKELNKITDKMKSKEKNSK